MVDNVRFAAARPVQAHRLLPVGKIAHSPQKQVEPATPQALSLAAALAQKGPPYDVEKVARLRAAISSGTYVVSLGEIAGAMMRFGGGPRV